VLAFFRTLAAIGCMTVGWGLIFSVFAVPFLLLLTQNLDYSIKLTVSVGLLIALLQLALLQLIPQSWKVKGAFKSLKPYPLPKAHPFYQSFGRLAANMGVATPTIWLIPTKTLNAFALGSASSSAVVFSTELTQVLDPDELAWVAAHELAHIKHGDTYSSTFWVLAIKTLGFGYRLRGYLLRFIARILDISPLPGKLVYLIVLPLILLAYLTNWIEQLTRSGFVVIDRFIGRQMEYAADKVAARYVDRSAGIKALQKLHQGVEVMAGIFATHPTGVNRLKRLAGK